MYQKIILGIGALGLFYLGYVLFFQSNQFALDDEYVNSATENLVAKTQVFIERRAQLDSVSLDGGLFTDERFTSLVSYTTTLSNQTVGKTSIFDLPNEISAYTNTGE